ncbi:tripartite tricarboxylate transporter TctB family protein [Limnohabitans sp. 15K]|uniref:tripartite tricarboxylate transporter TctB family protein n=1 Tax=Limnohabitans sp. 15K TaxID=1100706 RepID=UPI001E53971C|nr:tripartite tricarboxylate transporter TctB family protein [Limnohabitans sp. 15K]
MNSASDNLTWSWDKGLVLLLSLVAAAVLMATPQLITPYPAQAAWFESAAFFPRVTLGLACMAGLFELYQRRNALELADSDELDSSAANIRQALGMLALFGLYMLAVPWMGYLSSTWLFLTASGAWLGLSRRATLGLSVLLSLGMWVVFVKVLKVYFGHGWLI